MRIDLSNLGIRQQLLGLFGLFLITGLLVMTLDQVGQYFTQRSMVAMKDDVLVGMRHIRRLSNAYEQDVIDTTFRTRNYLTDWKRADAVVAQAQHTMNTEWVALKAMPLDEDGRALLVQAQQARLRADAATATLRKILHEKDVRALGNFADRELYPAIDPVVERLEAIDQRSQARAEALVRTELQRAAWVGRIRIGLSLLCLLLAAVYGRRILRNGYRGVESLTGLARRMAEHDYAAKPKYLPRGELGEVMEAFLRMRTHVQRIEAQLTDQLASTERVRGAMEQREQFQRLLLEAAQTAIFAVDEDGVFSLVNPFAERLLGWQTGSLLGRESLDAILDPEALRALARSLSDAYGYPVATDWTALRELARHREPPREFVLRHQRGRTLPVLLALSAVRDDTGVVSGLLAVATDLTALKRLERALRDSETRARDANHAKSAFLAAMSHEIRTPMIGVTGMIEVLSHTQLDDDQRQSLQVVQESAETLLRIIGDILDFSKIEAGRMEIEPVPTSLPMLLHSVAANYSGTASSKGLVLNCDIDQKIARAHYADPVRVRQIIGNFLSNAIKFTARGGITLSVRQLRHDPSDGALGSDLLELCVVDTGIGISAQAQARLFQPFAQAEADTTRRYGGTGLGLAISRRIAELMGGEISLESALGKGTTMRLTVALLRAPPEELPNTMLPAAAATGFTPRTAPAASEAERARRLILLVDDHPTNRQVIQRQMALAGYTAELAEDGIDGLEQWRSGRFALVLSDVHMPRMDGYQLAQAIRKDERERGLPRMPVIALTASALKGEAERCLAAGMDDYLTKPVGVNALAACMQRWLPVTSNDAEQAKAEVDAQASVGATSDERSSDAAVLDRDVLRELVGDDPHEIRALMDDYLQSTDADMAALLSLNEGSNPGALATQAHRIKGAARLVGACQLAECAEVLEGQVRAGADAATGIASVQAAYRALRADLRARPPGASAAKN